MKVNVAQFISSFQQGGSEGQAVQTVKLLNDTGNYNTFVATLESSGVLRTRIDEAAFSGLEEFVLTSFYDLNFLQQIRRSVAMIKRHRTEIVHTHDFYTNVFGMITGFLARVPVRIASRRETIGTRSSAQKQLELAVYRLAHAVIANSEAVRKQLLDEGVPTQKIHVIYNGLDIDRFTIEKASAEPSSRRQIIESFGLPADKRRSFVTIVANFRLEVKDHPTFLRAARRVLETEPFASFILAGEGTLMKPMRALADQMGIGGSTFFIGQCDRLPELLAISDVCVLSSKAEGFSNSILEYMGAGRPVVVTDVGGAREAVKDGETGYLVPAGDDEMMASRIATLLANRQAAREMGALGQRLVAERFTCAGQISGIELLYRRFLTSARINKHQ